ncbi:MAG TPA: hypothetical protein VMC80_01020 [Patescibacteria group bacterium]|nr:hypothetical protein [Patescibacteria group bacterium]
MQHSRKVEYRVLVQHSTETEQDDMNFMTYDSFHALEHYLLVKAKYGADRVTAEKVTTRISKEKLSQEELELIVSG